MTNDFKKYGKLGTYYINNKNPFLDNINYIVPDSNV